MGKPKTSQPVNVTRTPASRSRKPATRRFGGVPMSVAIPPIEAP